MSDVSGSTLLPKVESRKEFMDCLENMISQPLRDGEEYSRGRPRDLKTYIIESDDRFPKQFECGGVSGEISDTGLDDMKILSAFYADGRLEFFLDISDQRFLTLHTNEKSDSVCKIIDALTGDRNHMFDNTWFHSNMLKRFSTRPGNKFKGFGVAYTNSTFSPTPDEDSDVEDLSLSINGSLAPKVQAIVEAEPGVGRTMAYNTIRILRGQPPDSVQDDVHNNGYFAVKRGRSVQDHLYLVDSCKKEYSKTIHDVESSSIGTRKIEDKILFGGGSFDFEFKHEIEDIDLFISRMFNSTKPFKLWGLKSKISDDYYKITAVDLHIGSPINFDIAKDMMRVSLFKGSCGNTILRLFTNLQIHFDSNITCKQLGN